MKTKINERIISSEIRKIDRLKKRRKKELLAVIPPKRDRKYNKFHRAAAARAKAEAFEKASIADLYEIEI